jgi:hypothetical protein
MDEFSPLTERPQPVSGRRWVFPAALMFGALTFAGLRSGPLSGRSALLNEEVVVAGSNVAQKQNNDATVTSSAGSNVRQASSGNDLSAKLSTTSTSVS